MYEQSIREGLEIAQRRNDKPAIALGHHLLAELYLKCQQEAFSDLKPFSLKPGEGIHITRFAGPPVFESEIEIDEFYNSVTIRGDRRVLSHRQLAIFKLLLARKGEVIPYLEILEEIWPEDRHPTITNVQQVVNSLRWHLDVYGDLIETEWKQGYRLWVQ